MLHASLFPGMESVSNSHLMLVSGKIVPLVVKKFHLLKDKTEDQRPKTEIRPKNKDLRDKFIEMKELDLLQ